MSTTTSRYASFYNEKRAASDLRKYRENGPIPSTAREESMRRGRAGRVTYLHGYFVELAESVPSTEIVTLDRVINVYPDWELLAGLAAVRAERLYGLVYPRDTRMVRFVIFMMNLFLHLLRKPVRAAVRSPDTIERIARENGLSPHGSRNIGAAWQVSLYHRG